MILSDLGEAPDLMRDWDVLERMSDTGRWRFKVELLRRWIAAERPPRRVLPLLNRLDVVADGYFHTAAGLWQARGVEDEGEVRKLLEKALEKNENHAEAALLLAKIEASSGAEEAALGRLRNLYSIQPLAARPALLGLLLRRAARGDAASGASCREVLEIAPGHPEAAALLRKLALDAAESALAQGDLEIAAQKVEEAGKTARAEEIRGQIADRAIARGAEQVRQLVAEERFEEAVS